MINFPSDDRNFHTSPATKPTTNDDRTVEATENPATAMTHAQLKDWLFYALTHPKKPPVKLTPEAFLGIVRRCAIVFLVLDVPLMALGLFLFPSKPAAIDKPAVCGVVQVGR